jgi:TPP-dependent pyruvate/acetoin dehydrogenase alpha subunit
MTDSDVRTLGKKILKLRLAQKIVNERYKKGEFKIPIHLAMGHEAIAVALENIALPDDNFVLTHRNVHHNFLRLSSIRDLLNEYNLKQPSVSSSNRGSMNLDNPSKGIAYSSSILGNNLPVGAGMALGAKIKKKNSVTFIMSGDGAIEEGAFYESLLFMKSYNCASVIVVENNEWSLGTKIDERRCPIDLAGLAASMGIEYMLLSGNDVLDYIQALAKIRRKSSLTQSPILVEVKLVTLGHWILKNDEHVNGKYVNYHAGPAPTVAINEPFLIEESTDDPVFVTQNLFEHKEWDDLKSEILTEAKREGLL